MKLFKILSERKYFLAAILSSIIMLVAFPLFQSLGNPQIWFTFIKPLNFALYLVFSILFGITLSVQYYSFKHKQQSCEIKSASANAGTVLGLFAFQCPACVPVLAQALGLGAVTFLSVYKTQLILIGIGLMLVSLYLLGAFKPDAQV
ncbi:TPA: hypothetical protein H1009_01040 [archaeon]|nr:hypothetical protein [Candidatus Naiadarchaeales archaeon SRR2090153.bin461]